MPSPSVDDSNGNPSSCSTSSTLKNTAEGSGHRVADALSAGRPFTVWEAVPGLKVTGGGWLPPDAAALSDAAWQALQPGPGAKGRLSHPEPPAAFPSAPR